jgi:hypothetical protein
MRDIVARLRSTTIVYSDEARTNLVALKNIDGEDAAQEIERLRDCLELAARITEDHWLDWPKEEISAAIRNLLHHKMLS